MLYMTRERFEKIVAEGIDVIPEKFLNLLKNVVIVVEDEPTPGQRKKLKIGQSWSLFGLYEGVPQSQRGSNYTAVLPDKITIFQKSIEEVADDEEEIKEIVRNTVWHEIAHHFGMDEEEVRKAEGKKKKYENPPQNWK
jgi:predicted Zn-dependent protease with MMP-like domain